MSLPWVPYFPESPSPEMAELVERLCHGDLTPTDGERLEQLVACDQRMRQFYVRYLQMHAMLSWCAGAGLPADSASSESETALPATVGAPSAIFDAPSLVPSFRPPADPSSPTLSFLGRVRVVLGRPACWSMFAVAMLFCGAFALVSWSLRAEKLSSAAIKHGKLLAIAPREVVDFTLKTPLAKIIDRGTEFDVEVASEGGLGAGSADAEVSPFTRNIAPLMQSLLFFATSDNNSGPSKGAKMDLAAVWGRALTADEIANLSQNPDEVAS